MSILTEPSARRRVNVCFHGVGTPGRDLEEGESRYWVSEYDFLRLLDHAVDDSREVSLSIDDANASDVDVVLPALIDRGVRATFFVVVDRLDRPGSMGSADARELARAGMIIGSHGWTHVPWTSCTGLDLKREVSEARAALQELTGDVVSTAALPLGRYNRAVLRAARAEGFSTVFTSDRQLAGPQSWLQARFSVEDGVTPESFHSMVRRADRAPTRAYSSMKRLGKRLR